MVQSATWRPRSEAELRAVIAAGDLEETHFFEIKQDIAEGKGGGKELARDLAQFGIDGGILLVGVAETKDASPSWHPTPIPLAGLSERVEQLARSAVDPPLNIRVDQFPADAAAAIGYLVVEVPASPRAPHMVDGLYFGRGDKTRHRLSDAEVMRLHAARRDSEEEINRLLDAEIARDPWPQSHRGHLYLVAHPQMARQDLAQNLLQGDVRRLLQVNGEATVEYNLQQWAPRPSAAFHMPRRAHGVALCSPELRDGRQVSSADDSSERTSLDIELREDGGVRVFLGRLTDERNSVPLILDGLAIAYATRLVEWARSVGFVTGYNGRWLLGVAGNGLRGRRSITFEERFMDEGPTYDTDEYRQTTTAEYFELDEKPGDVVERLVGRLLRGLGTAEYFDSHVHHSTTVRAAAREGG